MEDEAVPILRTTDGRAALPREMTKEFLKADLGAKDVNFQMTKESLKYDALDLGPLNFNFGQAQEPEVAQAGKLRGESTKQGENIGPREEPTSPRKEVSSPREEAPRTSEEPSIPREEPSSPREEPSSPREEPSSPREEAPNPREEPSRLVYQARKLFFKPNLEPSSKPDVCPSSRRS